VYSARRRAKVSQLSLKRSDMANEEKLQQDLTTRFGFLAGKVRIQRARRMWVDVPAESLNAVLGAVVKDLQFSILLTMTGLDSGESFEIIVHLAHWDGTTMHLKVLIPKANPVWQSLIPTFANAELYEREIADLLGVQVQGLPPGSRYPLPDNWPAGQFPLRKDWKQADLATQEGPA
jgi:membrane-bound hydrogenase subunit beta